MNHKSKLKQIVGILLLTAIAFTICACQGNWEKINLKDPVAIPVNGIIAQNVIQQIKDENAIAVFAGESNGYQYEWSIFGNQLNTIQDVNLLILVSQDAEGNVHVAFDSTKSFGFNAFLSIHLKDLWNAQSATAYQGDKEVGSVSLTGTQYTILNISTDGTLGEILICPDILPDDGSSNTVPTGGEKDQYLTDPVPEGKPNPVEPEDAEVNKGRTYTCTFSIECSTILNNLDMLDPEKLEIVPMDGVILAKTTVTFYEGESVFDVLQRLCKEKGIHMEAEWTPIYNSAYVEGIHNLYEFDCGALSGWMYKVNGWYPNYGSSRYQLKDGDVVEWRYTCDLGNDVGGGYAVGG